MAPCEFVEKCPIFARFRLDTTKSFWIELYCQGSKQSECARKKLKLQGGSVPENLLPNGKLMAAHVM